VPARMRCVVRAACELGGVVGVSEGGVSEVGGRRGRMEGWRDYGSSATKADQSAELSLAS
jgi:hypothetical protein